MAQDVGVARIGVCGLPTGCVIVDRRFAESLHTRPCEVFESVARVTKLGAEQFTAQLPRGRVDALDAQGLVRVGSDVQAGDILVGKTTPRMRGAARDTSLRVPRWIEGTVVEAQLEPTQDESEHARARVVVQIDRPLVVGDTLITETGVEGVVCDIHDLDGEPNLQWTEAAGTAQVSRHALAEDSIHARSIGPYSLVTQKPLGGRNQCGGQELTAGQGAALIAGGAVLTFTEMMTNKSDSVSGRTGAYVALIQGRNPDPFTGDAESLAGSPAVLMDDAHACIAQETTPETTGVLQRQMAAVGIFATLGRAGVTAKLLTEAEMRALSHGPVLTPETINYRTFAPEIGGLFCAKVFGPLRDYECQCGELRGRDADTQRCAECGTECTTSAVRRSRFGHVDLALPMPHPWFTREIALLLGLDHDDLLRVAGAAAGLRDGHLVDEREMTKGETAGPGILTALQAIDLETVKAAHVGQRAAVAEAMLKRAMTPSDLVLRVVPVLPPDLRPLVPLDQGRFTTTDLNDLYRRFINTNNRLARLLELSPPDIIIRDDMRRTFTALQSLFANGRGGDPVTGPDERPLRSLLDAVQAGARELLIKRVDYSGQAILVSDSSLDSETCLLPMTMACELFKPWAYQRMEQQGYITRIREAKAALEVGEDFALDAIDASAQQVPALLMVGDHVIAREIALWHGRAIAVDPVTAERLGVGKVVSIHIPLSEQARAECRDLPDSIAPTPIPPHKAPPHKPGAWFTALTHGADVIETLRHAAIYGDEDPIEDPAVQAALGRRPSQR